VNGSLKEGISSQHRALFAVELGLSQIPYHPHLGSCVRVGGGVNEAAHARALTRAHTCTYTHTYTQTQYLHTR